MPITFKNCFPGSMLIFNLQVSNSKKLQFDLKDDLEHLNLFIRIGEVGIIAALQDAQALEKQSGHYFENNQQYKLHPIQFEELGAKFFCWSSKMNRVPKFIIGVL